MKKIALFGATGKTGMEFLKLAIDKGWQIKALARNPAKLNLKHPRLEVIKGDVLNENNVKAVVKDCDLVVSLFGHVKGSPEWLQTNGTKNIISAMKQFSLEKIISLSGGGLPYPEKDQPKLADKLICTIMKVAAPNMLNDAIAHHKVLASSSRKWIIVRGPRLNNGKKRGTYRVGWVGVNAGTSISRADLADFIVKQVDDEQFLFQMPYVSY